ncbi:MAG: hypothetical protein IJT02_07530 [Synergistaceae bacterium]|nr:hypothetical protein [Synergistaceae bacterium]
MKKYLALMAAVLVMAFAGAAFGAGHNEPTTPPTPTTPSAGVEIVTRVTETITSTRTITATVITGAAQQSVAQTTFAQTIMSVARAIADILANALAGVTAEQKQWASSAESIQTSAQGAVDTDAKRAALFPGVTTDTTPQENDQLEAAVSSTSDDATVEQKLAAVSDRLGSGNTALSTGTAVRPKKSGTYKQPKVFGSALFGTKIMGDRGLKASVKGSGIQASAVDNSGIAFLNSKGESIDAIPGSGDSTVMPGFVNMLVVMEAGQVYEPTIYTSVSDLPDTVSTDTASATVNVVSYDVETVKVVTDENGNTVESVVVAVDTSVMAAVLGATPTNALLVEGAEFPTYSMDTVITEAKSRNYAVMTTGIPAMNNLPAGLYYVASIDFEAKPASADADASFDFYPKGFSSASKDIRVFDSAQAELATPNDAYGKTNCYVVFKVNDAADDIVSISAYDVSAPVLAAKLQVAAQNNGGEENNNLTFNDPGSSGGGCSAGFTALALAVLGGFIAARKK